VEYETLTKELLPRLGEIRRDYVSNRYLPVVLNLLVDEEYRRRGIGMELAHRAEQFAGQHHCRAISVEAQATNWPALSFCTKMGSRICGVAGHFFANRDLGRREVALFLRRGLR
jgi:ribosomal protein S18 acetylase RimI-like enzyme